MIYPDDLYHCILEDGSIASRLVVRVTDRFVYYTDTLGNKLHCLWGTFHAWTYKPNTKLMVRNPKYREFGT